MLDVKYFNTGIKYKNGFFIITDPGYYRITIQCYHNQSGPDFRYYAVLSFKAASKPLLGTCCSHANNGSSTGIFYLEAFDILSVGKSGQPLAGGAYYNNIMIEKV